VLRPAYLGENLQTQQHQREADPDFQLRTSKQESCVIYQNKAI
jgi:hypothetical protein